MIPFLTGLQICRLGAKGYYGDQNMYILSVIGRIIFQLFLYASIYFNCTTSSTQANSHGGPP